MVFMLVGLLTLFIGCNNETQQVKDENENKNEETVAEKQKEEPESITLRVSFGWGTLEEYFEMVKPLAQKQFPNITFETIPSGQMSVDELIATGKMPDIQLTGYAQMRDLNKKAIPLDLTELINKYNLDLDVYNKELLEGTRMYGNGVLLGLPFDTMFYYLLYNKDIFDLFGVGYPKANMSWSETIELGRGVNRTVDGIHYNGLKVRPNVIFVGRGLSLSPIDPNTDKAKLNTDDWVKVMELLKTVYSMPNNRKFDGAWNTAGIQQGLLAMYASQGVFDQRLEDTDVNWDVTTYPHFEESPGRNMESWGRVYIIWSTSNHKDKAFEVISYLSTSPEVQEYAARKGYAPAIHMDNIGEIFGSDLEMLKDKHVEEIFMSQYRESHMTSDYETYANQALQKYLQLYLDGEVADVRTALARAEEEANLAIQTAKQE